MRDDLLLLFFILFTLCALTLLIGCADSRDALPPENADTAAHKADRPIKEGSDSITPSGIHDVRLLFMNVGKADAAIVLIDRHAWLVDTGTEASVPVLFAGLENLGISSLDGVLITHTDNDHVGGLSALLDEVAVSAVYTSSISANWDKVEDLRGEIPRVALDSGATVPVTEGVWFEVLGPIRYNPRDDNNSLVLRLRVNGAAVLFAGDMMFEEENTLLSAGMDLKCDLLKVGHHGKKDATSKPFARACAPDVAIISADREQESDSAHESVIKTLQETGSGVYVTENYSIGIDVRISAEGKPEISDLLPVNRGEHMEFVKVSREEQLVILKNIGETAIDVSRWWILPERGKKAFRFPDGTTIPAGGTVRIGTNDTAEEADFRWDETKVWHRKKPDSAILIDRWGNQVDSASAE